MQPSILALLGYAGWTLWLVVSLLSFRTWLTLTGKRAANDFLPTGEDVSALSQRHCRAMANSFDNFPIFAVLILVAVLTDNAGVTDGLALWVLAARVGQSCVHLLSTSEMAVTVRFTLYSVQVGIEVYWLVQLVKLAM